MMSARFDCEEAIQLAYATQVPVHEMHEGHLRSQPSPVKLVQHFQCWCDVKLM